MKTQYTSVSEDEQAIKHFSGELYRTESDHIVGDNHNFIAHSELSDRLKSVIASSSRGERVTASRALQLALRAKEAVIDWRFNLETVPRKDRITWCFNNVQKYFHKV